MKQHITQCMHSVHCKVHISTVLLDWACIRYPPLCILDCYNINLYLCIFFLYLCIFVYSFLYFCIWLSCPPLYVFLIFVFCICICILYFLICNLYFIFCTLLSGSPLYVFLIATTSICELTDVTLWLRSAQKELNVKTALSWTLDLPSDVRKYKISAKYHEIESTT